MRNDKRGLSTGALVGIIVGVIIAIVVPVTIAVVLLVGVGGGGGGGALANVPVYPGAQESGENVEQAIAAAGYSLSAGWSGKAYYIQASPETVIAWYENNMPGWTKTGDNTVESGGVTVYVLAYTKGNDAAIIEAFSYTSINYLIILAGPSSGGGGSGTGSSIIGTWQGTHLGSTETFTFKNDWTYDWSSDGSQQSGTWSMSGDILTLDTTCFKVVFAPNSMKWYEQDPSTGNWDVLSRSFTKVA